MEHSRASARPSRRRAAPSTSRTSSRMDHCAPGQRRVSLRRRPGRSRLVVEGKPPMTPSAGTDDLEARIRGFDPYDAAYCGPDALEFFDEVREAYRVAPCDTAGGFSILTRYEDALY